MIRELFHIGPIPISPFGVMLVLAFLASYFQLRSGMRQLDIGEDDDASSLLFAGGLGGIAGAKIYYAALYRDWHLLFDRSGLVWYGGFLGGALAFFWVIWRHRLPTWSVLDAAGPALSLGYAVGRIGCFLVGDDYGRPTDLPWGVRFAHGLPPTTAGYLRSEFGVAVPANVPDDALLAVHPTQVYETLIGVGIWLFGLWLLRRRPPAGTVFLAVAGLLALERFGIEMLRAKDDRFFGPFTLAQAISVGLLVYFTVLLLRRRHAAAAA